MWQTIVGGTIALVGGMLGAVLSHLFERRSAEERLRAEDARRWTLERRELYGRFAALCARVVSLIEAGASEIDDSWQAECQRIMETEVEPTLEAMTLVASPRVVEESFQLVMSVGVTMGLMISRQAVNAGVVTAEGEDRVLYLSRDSIGSCRDALHELRSAMRVELGLEPLPDDEDDETDSA